MKEFQFNNKKKQMQLSEDEVFEKNGKHCGHCNRNTLVPYEFEFSSVVCGFNLIKRKHELTKTQRKKQILSIDQTMLSTKYFVFV